MTKALPNAGQVADRWHLMENASSAYLDAVRKSMRPIRAVIGADTINPALLTCAEQLQYESYLRREETNAAIVKLAGDGIPIKEIVHRTDHDRKLVRQVVRGERTDIFRIRQSSLDAYLPMLEEAWNAGCRNGAELWRCLQAKGFRGSLACCRRVGDPPPPRRARIRPATSKGAIGQTDSATDDDGPRSPRQTRHSDHSGHRGGGPMLVEARGLTDSFQTMVRTRSASDLDAWVREAGTSLVASFASGFMRDRAVVHAAIMEPWSNGETEGQITKLRLVRRKMHGCRKLDLAQARLIGAA